MITKIKYGSFFITVCTVICLLLPSITSFAHSFQDHHHFEDCQIADHHFHEQTLDCDHLDISLQKKISYSLDTIKLITPTNYRLLDTAVIEEYAKNSTLPWESRGPPSTLKI